MKRVLRVWQSSLRSCCPSCPLRQEAVKAVEESSGGEEPRHWLEEGDKRSPGGFGWEQGKTRGKLRSEKHTGMRELDLRSRRPVGDLGWRRVRRGLGVEIRFMFKSLKATQMEGMKTS